MRFVERNQIGQCSHVGVCKHAEVIRHLRFEFVKERGKFVISIREHIARIGVDDGCTEALHYIEGVVGKCDRLLVAWNAAAVVAVIEEANVATDPRSLKCPAFEKLSIISWQRPAGHFAERRLQHTEQDGDIRNAARHRTGCVLFMSNWNNSVL